jgi:hypothetical protein
LATWAETLTKLWALQPESDMHGNPRPKLVDLDSTARKAWERFATELAEEMNAADCPDVLRGPWAKMRGHGARLALILHLLHQVTNECTATEVTGVMIDKAAEIVRYFQSHARKVYAHLGADEELEACRRVLSWIEREGRRTFKAWELHKDVKNQSHFPKLEDLDGPLERLCKHNYIRRPRRPEQQGPGRPKDPGFEVNPLFAQPSGRAD